MHPGHLFLALALLSACAPSTKPCGGSCPGGKECIDNTCQRLCNTHIDCPVHEICAQGSCVAGEPGNASSGTQPSSSSSTMTTSSSGAAMCGGEVPIPARCPNCEGGTTCKAGVCVSPCDVVMECSGGAPACGNACRQVDAECVDIEDKGICDTLATTCTAVVPLADTRRLPDGGIRDIPDEVVCNPGPAVLAGDGGVIYAGGRICQRFPELNPAPPVLCVSAGAAGFPSYIGFCRATCKVPSETRPDDKTFACPPGTACDTRGRIFTSYRPDGGTVSCTVDGECPTGALCRDLGNGNVCAFPHGFCQPSDGGP